MQVIGVTLLTPTRKILIALASEPVRLPLFYGHGAPRGQGEGDTGHSWRWASTNVRPLGTDIWRRGAGTVLVPVLVLRIRFCLRDVER